MQITFFGRKNIEHNIPELEITPAMFLTLKQIFPILLRLSMGMLNYFSIISQTRRIANLDCHLHIRRMLILQLALLDELGRIAADNRPWLDILRNNRARRDKRAHHDAQFPKDLENARALGRRLVEKARAVQ